MKNIDNGKVCLSYISYSNAAINILHLLFSLQNKKLIRQETWWNFFIYIYIYIYFFLVWRDTGVSLKGLISRLPEQPCWFYA